MTENTELTGTPNQPTPKRPRKMAREARARAAESSSAADKAAGPAKRPSKSDLVLALLLRPEGATIDQLVASTGWLPHTTRAALIGLKKKGHVVSSSKLEGRGRVYRVVAG